MSLSEGLQVNLWIITVEIIVDNMVHKGGDYYLID